VHNNYSDGKYLPASYGNSKCITVLKDPANEPFPDKNSSVVNIQFFLDLFYCHTSPQIILPSGRLYSSSPTEEKQENPSVRTDGFRAKVRDRDLLNKKHGRCSIDRDVRNISERQVLNETYYRFQSLLFLIRMI
jgi:hypothetical protein